MRFEDSISHSLDHRNPGEHPVIVEMQKKAERILANDAINPKDFIDLYGEENVSRDLKRVESFKSKFEHDDGIKKVSDVLEGLVYQLGELGDWFGKNVETIRSSEYDDIINGIDLIAEFNTEDFTKHLALGVDVTFGTLSIGKKFERIKKEIDSDKLALVKYFESHGFKGALKHVPRVVIGLEKDTIISLAALWMRNQNAELGNHFAQDILMREILEQLTAFKKYAESIGAEKAVRSYTQALAILATAFREHNANNTHKERQHMHHEEIIGDRVYKDIRVHLEVFKPASKTT